jgi:CRP/FNR family cyclic AMP-dependent transcriptional regulator
VVATDNVEVLKRVSMFATCSQEELAGLAASAKEVQFPAGAVVLEEGAHAASFFVVVDGSLEASANGDDARPLGPGDYFGEIALITAGDRTATVKATTDAVLLEIPASDFRRLLRSAPPVALDVMGTIAERTEGNCAERDTR